MQSGVCAPNLSRELANAIDQLKWLRRAFAGLGSDHIVGSNDQDGGLNLEHDPDS